MDDATKLFRLKLLHTIIWVFFNAVLAYLYYAVLTDQVGYLFWIGVGMIALECVVLIFNDWSCPLSPIARQYTDNPKDNFDIFLPNWLAKYNIQIYSTLAAILAVLFVVK